MLRYVAGALMAILLGTGGFLIFQSQAESPRADIAEVPAATETAMVDEDDNPAGPALPSIGRAPDADPKSKEEKRFGRVDKNDDGRITLAEMVEPRRKAYAKLDRNGDGKLSFEEWSVKTIEKFQKANANGDDALNPAEFATTAPKRKAPRPVPNCPQPRAAAPAEADSDG